MIELLFNFNHYFNGLDDNEGTGYYYRKKHIIKLFLEP